MITEIFSLQITPFTPPCFYNDSGRPSSSPQLLFQIVYDVQPKIDAKQNWPRKKLDRPGGPPLFSSTIKSWNSNPSACACADLLQEFHRLEIHPGHHQELLSLIVERVRHIINFELPPVVFQHLSAVILLIKIINIETYSALKRLEEEDGGQVCSICLEDIGENGGSTECGHVFHCDCITQWFDIGHNCPLCRTMVPVSTKILTEPNKPRKSAFI